MSAIRFLSVLGVLVMVATITFGLVSGDFSGEGAEIVGFAWGKVTLIDLYVGLVLFGGWVGLREESWPMTVFWWLLLIVLGNLATAVYVALAAFRSADLRELMLGSGR
jgi:hypothetical protein